MALLHHLVSLNLQQPYSALSEVQILPKQYMSACRLHFALLWHVGVVHLGCSGILSRHTLAAGDCSFAAPTSDTLGMSLLCSIGTKLSSFWMASTATTCNLWYAATRPWKLEGFQGNSVQPIPCSLVAFEPFPTERGLMRRRQAMKLL